MKATVLGYFFFGRHVLVIPLVMTTFCKCHSSFCNVLCTVLLHQVSVQPAQDATEQKQDPPVKEAG